MYEKSLNTIEFNKVVDLLANEAESELGYEYCLQLKPSTAKDEIEKWIEDTDEAFQLIIKRGNPPLFGVKSIGMEIKRVEMGGGLSPGGLLKISETLRCARALKNYLSDTKGDDKVSIYKNISGLIGNLGVYRSIEEAREESKERYKIIFEKFEELIDDQKESLSKLKEQFYEKH